MEWCRSVGKGPAIEGEEEGIKDMGRETEGEGEMTKREVRVNGEKARWDFTERRF